MLKLQMINFTALLNVIANDTWHLCEKSVHAIKNQEASCTRFIQFFLNVDSFMPYQGHSLNSGE